MIFYIYINKIINNSPSISCLQKYKLKIPQHTSFVSCVLDEAFPVSHTSFFCFRFCFLCQFKFLLSRENLHAAFSRDFSFPVPANRFRDRNQRFNLRSIPSPFRFPASSQRGNTKNNNPTSIPSFSHSLTTSLFNLGFQNFLLRFSCVAGFKTRDNNRIYYEFA